MFRNNVLERIKRGEKALGISMNDPSEELVEIAGRMGLDFVNFDGQHAPLTPERVGTLCRIADGFGITPTMRIPDGEESTILSYLDRGIRQITVPNLLTREQAEDWVKWTFFQPLGLRSSTSHKMVSYQDSQDRVDLFNQANANVVLVPQIENINTVENLEEILTVDGIDYYGGGPEDMAQSLGIPGGHADPKVAEAYEKATAKLEAAGKGWWARPHREPSTLSASSRGRWRASWKPTAASRSSPGRLRPALTADEPHPEDVSMNDGNADFTLLKAARVIDGLGGPPIERGAVLMQGDAIQAVGPEEEVVPPEGANVSEINYEDKTALPGLVDCHVHMVGIGDGRAGDDLTLLPDEVLTLQAAKNARTHLYSGVTTVRDCGAKNRTTFMLRQAVEMGIAPSPRLLLSGRPIAIIGGHLSYFGIEATGEVECRAAVRQLIKEGADFIKITATGGSTRTSFALRPSFTVEEMTAICDEAHKFGKHAAAHCVSAQAMVNSLDAGVDTIIHGYYRGPDGGLEDRPDVTERLARQGVFVNLTLHQGRQRMWDLQAKKEREGVTVGGAGRDRPDRGRQGGGPGARREAQGRRGHPRLRLRRRLGALQDGRVPGRGRDTRPARNVADGGHRLGDQRLREVVLGGGPHRIPGARQAGRCAGR